MKLNMRTIAPALAIVLVSTLVTACSDGMFGLPVLKGTDGATGDLTLVFQKPDADGQADNLSTSTVLPQTYNIATYDVLMETSAHANIRENAISTASHTFADVPVYDWTVTVFAYDGSGKLVGQSQPTVVPVETGTNTAEIPMSLFTDGTGTIDVSYSWTADLVDQVDILFQTYPELSEVTTDASRNEIASSISIDTTDGTARLNGTFDGGTYLLSWSAQKNGVPHPSNREIVHVFNDHTSSKSITIEDRWLNDVPEAPDTLTASMPNATTIDLSWRDLSGVEEGYRLQRDGEDLAELPPNTTSYSDDISGLGGMPGVYQVIAYNSLGSATPTEYQIQALTSVRFSQPAYAIGTQGGTVTTNLVFEPEDALNQFVTYHSSGSAIVSVDSAGVLTLLSDGGHASITVTSADGEHTHSILAGDIPVIEVTATNYTGHSPDEGYLAIAAGWNHAFGIKDGTTFGWGYNDYNAIGDGGTTDRNVPTELPAHFDQIAPGGEHTLALTDTGDLYAWGNSGSGQVGNGTVSSQVDATKIGTGYVSISAGRDHSMAIKTDGTLWSWGDNGTGELGLNDNIDKSTPTQVGSDTHWAAVAAGHSYTLAIKTDGTLWSWGYNYFGQLGLGDYNERNTPTQVGADTDWATVAAGEDAAYAIKTDGTLYSWGYYYSGQLGDGSSRSRSTPGQVGTDTDWSAISSTGDHVLALKTDGSLWTWGRNNYGQIGNGTTDNQDTAAQLGTDTDWVGIAAGYTFSLALKSDGTIYTWGRNYDGQLGQGHDDSYVTTPEVVRNRTITPGEQVSVDLRVGNSGVQTALGLSATINSSSAYVSGVNGFAGDPFSFGTLAPNYFWSVYWKTAGTGSAASSETGAELSARRTDTFVVQLSSETPPGTEVPLAVTFNDADGLTWTEDITLEVPQ